MLRGVQNAMLNLVLGLSCHIVLNLLKSLKQVLEVLLVLTSCELRDVLEHEAVRFLDLDVADD